MYWNFDEETVVKSARQTSQLFTTEVLSVFGSTDTVGGDPNKATPSSPKGGAASPTSAPSAPAMGGGGGNTTNATSATDSATPGTPAGSGDGAHDVLRRHQQAIPRLPVPTLQETCTLYLRSLEGIVNAEEYSRAASHVAQFLQSPESSRLQQLLDDREAAQDQPSWLEEFWDDAYLYTRDPVPININYFFGFDRQQPAKSSNAGASASVSSCTSPLRPSPQLQFSSIQVVRASALLHGAILFYVSVRDQTLTVDTERDAPLCMSQFRRVFCASRIPGEARDRIISYSTAPLTADELLSKTTSYERVSPRHCVVMSRNRYFKLVVLHEDGSPVPLQTIAEALVRIQKVAQADGQQSGPPIGVLTTMHRDDWFDAREQLHERNAHTLALLQSAILLLCLDNLVVEDAAEAARLLLHGAGTNRWFDRHNLIVSHNGVAGINFEHSVGDGITTLRIADQMYRYERTNALPIETVDGIFARTNNGRAIPPAVCVMPASAAATPLSSHHKDPLAADDNSSSFSAQLGHPSATTASGSFSSDGELGGALTELVWEVDSTIDNRMRDAYSSFRDQIQTNETQVLAFKHYGGNFIKQSKLSPDAFVQLAFQLTYYRLFGRNDATYEAASTRGFLHGRTETVRSASRAAADFCRAMKQDPLFDQKVGSSFPTARSLLFKAADAHVEYMRLAKQGRGVDRHLYGLRVLAKMNRIDLPPMFLDPCFARSSHWNMSTSHCGSAALNLFGFGPVVADGFGLGYMIKNDEIDVVITSKYTHRFISSSVYKSILEASLLEMKSLLECDVANRVERASQGTLFGHPTAHADFDYEPTRGFVYKAAAGGKRSLYRQRANSANSQHNSAAGAVTSTSQEDITAPSRST